MKIISLKNPLQIGLCNKAAYNYKKISLSKNQVRSSSTKFLYENINYIVAFIAYGIVIYSL
ncbi:hypothetical protein AAU60_15515 [Acinetobacter johnsonii]|nr:hypothetical protein AAU60_15515 [Acinetobacter johnsonii]